MVYLWSIRERKAINNWKNGETKQKTTVFYSENELNWVLQRKFVFVNEGKMSFKYLVFQIPLLSREEIHQTLCYTWSFNRVRNYPS